jgi:hypothetical protein
LKQLPVQAVLTGLVPTALTAPPPPEHPASSNDTHVINHPCRVFIIFPSIADLAIVPLDDRRGN